MTITLLTHRFVRPAIAAVAVALAVTTTVSAQHGATYEVVSSFGLTFRDGRDPSSLRQDTDGTFFGTTSGGGVFDKGVLFRIDATGVFTTLHSFSDPDGAQPFGLVRDSNGRFYGLTSQGGAFGLGTVFSFTPGGAVTTLHTFSAADSSPVDLFAASDGHVYGLTAGGGDFGNGTIFLIDPGGSVRTIYSVALSAGSGMTSLVKATDGRFYVTAGAGGDAGLGTIFTIDDAGTLTILHSFAGQGAGDGAAPVGLMQTRGGTLYGTTRTGGQFSYGTVYSIDLAGDYRVVHSFQGSVDGQDPGPDLLEGSDGNLYGGTRANRATLFRVDSTGTLTPLHVLSVPGFFTLPGPVSGELIEGLDGRLYGPTVFGGPDGGGTIITRDVAGTLTTFYQFSMGEGPGRPNGVIQGRDGTFYGTTSPPGTSSPPRGLNPIGSVFAMDAAGARTTLHTFNWSVAFGVNDGVPLSNLFEGADGSLYGTTYNANDSVTSPGQIFRISPAGDFTQLSSAYWLQAGVIQARDGRLYGTGSGGPSKPGLPMSGEVFRVDANGTRTVLHAFGGTNGANPRSELVEIDDGSFYGTTEWGAGEQAGPPLPRQHGTIFRLDPAITGSFEIRYRFNGPDGSRPVGRLIQGTDLLIYGTTLAGGLNGFGTVFSLDLAGTLTTLHHFSGADGENPTAGVIQGLDGRLYGVTTNGGAFGYGTVFVMNVTGGLTTLHHFTLSDGANPVNELIQANDGAFYGATSAGGPKDGGVIFRIRLATSPLDEYFEIVSRNSGKCLDVYGASTDAAASVIQWPCHGGPNQQWRLEPAGGGAVRILARHSGQALDVYGAWVDDVTPIIQWPVHGGENQVWTLDPAPDGHVRIVARHSGKAMDVEYASADDGARVIQYTPHGGANQQWLLRSIDTRAP